MSKYHKAIDFVLLGTIVIAGFADSTGLAIAGLAIYFTRKELQWI